MKILDKKLCPHCHQEIYSIVYRVHIKKCLRDKLDIMVLEMNAKLIEELHNKIDKIARDS